MSASATQSGHKKMGFTFWSTVYTVRSSSSRLLHSTWCHITINDTLAVLALFYGKIYKLLQSVAVIPSSMEIKSPDTNCLNWSINRPTDVYTTIRHVIRYLQIAYKVI